MNAINAINVQFVCVNYHREDHEILNNL